MIAEPVRNEIVMAQRILRDRNAPIVDGTGPASSRNEPVLAMIDDMLTIFVGRTLVTGVEVINCLLDLRNALNAPTSVRSLDESELVSR
jgi:hypothetical protein